MRPVIRIQRKIYCIFALREILLLLRWQIAILFWFYIVVSLYTAIAICLIYFAHFSCLQQGRSRIAVGSSLWICHSPARIDHPLDTPLMTQ